MYNLTNCKKYYGKSCVSKHYLIKIVYILFPKKKKKSCISRSLKKLFNSITTYGMQDFLIFTYYTFFFFCLQ